MITAHDVEWLALRRGFKPALRVATSAAEAADHEALFLRRGAVVVRASWQPPDARPPQEILYVARRLQDAEALRAVEAPLRDGGSAERLRDASLATGRLLGYPPCCAEAFVDRIERARGLGLDELRGLRKRALAAREAQVEAPRWELNNLLLDERVRLITFEPCLYDCPLALRFARAVLREIVALSATDAAELHRRLAVAIALDPGGRKALVQIADGRVVQARAPLSHDDRVLFARDAALSAEIEGAEVSALRGEPGGLLLLRFG
jgi:hypothetical protein